MENIDSFVEEQEQLEEEVEQVEEDQTSDDVEEVTETEEVPDTGGDTPEEGTEPEVKESHTVPVGVLTAERKKLQERIERLETELDQVKVEKPDFGSELAAPGPLDPNDPDPYSMYDDDEWDAMMPSEQRKVQTKREEWLMRENRRMATMQRQQELNAHEQAALTRFSVEKMGEGLDYQTVVNAGVNFLTADDRKDILTSSDPAAKCYELCKFRNPYIKSSSSQPDTQVATETKKPEPEPAPASLDEILTPSARLASSFVE